MIKLMFITLVLILRQTVTTNTMMMIHTITMVVFCRFAAMPGSSSSLRES